MILDFCAVCGTTNDLQQHHIEPVVLTGSKRYKKKKYNGSTQLKDATGHDCFSRLFDLGVISDDGYLTVCSFHHNILHGMIKFQKMEHSNLIKVGQARAKAAGKKLGRPTHFNEAMGQSVRLLREQGMPIKQIAKNLEIGVGTVYKALDKVA